MADIIAPSVDSALREFIKKGVKERLLQVAQPIVDEAKKKIDQEILKLVTEVSFQVIAHVKVDGNHVTFDLSDRRTG